MIHTIGGVKVKELSSENGPALNVFGCRHERVRIPYIGRDLKQYELFNEIFLDPKTIDHPS